MVKMLFFFFTLQIFFLQTINAQLPYTQAVFGVWKKQNIPYGTATDFAGGEVELTLDLYKPIGDGNCLRPLLVMVHGGGWIAGTKDDNDVVAICQQMAARGYACASINYRLGLHPDDYYEPYLFCNDNLNPLGINKCIYNADTLEITRALYRAMQDAKGAIRFLKNRHEMDSTDLGNVFVGGSSAGAFTALAAGLVDREEEKPAFTLALPDAPLPDSDLANCVPAPANRTRPDLGSIEGNLHLGTYDAKVNGIAAFMGGVFDQNLLAGLDTPAIYLYHRTDDLVVSCNHQPLFPLYPFCYNPINLCQPLYNRPYTIGSCSLAETLNGMGSAAPPFFNDILDFGPEGNDDCLDDPPGHSILNIPERCANLSGFFAPLIAATGNDPFLNCNSNATASLSIQNSFQIFPNPSKGTLFFRANKWPGAAVHLALLDAMGRELAVTTGSPNGLHWDLGHLNLQGIYFVKISAGRDSEVLKVVFR